MSTRKPDKATKQGRFLWATVRRFVKEKEIARMTVQNEYGAITVVRDAPTGQPMTHAVGFQDGNADDDEGDDYE